MKLAWPLITLEFPIELQSLIAFCKSSCKFWLRCRVVSLIDALTDANKDSSSSTTGCKLLGLLLWLGLRGCWNIRSIGYPALFKVGKGVVKSAFIRKVSFHSYEW